MRKIWEPIDKHAEIKEFEDLHNLQYTPCIAKITRSPKKKIKSVVVVPSRSNFNKNNNPESFVGKIPKKKNFWSPDSPQLAVKKKDFTSVSTTRRRLFCDNNPEEEVLQLHVNADDIFSE